MKKITFLFALVIVCSIFGFKSDAQAQNGPVMYFCESYGSAGEIGISDRFTTGYLTIMVKCDYALGLSNVSIQFDKYNCNTGSFDYFKKFNYVVDPDMKYIYFSKNDESDLNFSEPGIYRVFLLDGNDQTVTSALIQII